MCKITPPRHEEYWRITANLLWLQESMKPRQNSPLHPEVGTFPQLNDKEQEITTRLLCFMPVTFGCLKEKIFKSQTQRAGMERILAL